MSETISGRAYPLLVGDYDSLLHVDTCQLHACRAWSDIRKLHVTKLLHIDLYAQFEKHVKTTELKEVVGVAPSLHCDILLKVQNVIFMVT